MGMRKMWSRLIVVDDIQYRYHVAEDRYGGLELNICVQRVEPAGQRLLSGFRKPLVWSEHPAGGRSGRVTPYAVTPRVVRELILAALARGWLPAESGMGAFHLPGEQVVPRLPEPDCAS